VTKNNSVYRNYQAQLMGWMHLIILHRSIIRRLIQDNAGRRTLLTFSKMGRVWTWWLSILRIPFHTNIVCKSLRVYQWLDQKWLNIHFLFLSKN